MKAIIKLLVASFLITLTSTVYAQTEEIYQRKIVHYKSMKTIGIVLIAAAVPVGGIGTYWMVDGKKNIILMFMVMPLMVLQKQPLVP
jgi:hypothetical protein